jgi:hypothetical protein
MDNTIKQSECLNDDIINLSYYTKNTHILEPLENTTNVQEPKSKVDLDSMLKKIIYYSNSSFNKFTE